jgi:hypothetical protein
MKGLTIRYHWPRAASALAVSTFACASVSPTVVGDPVDETVRVALTDMGTRRYLGHPGGLYPGGLNDLPADHSAAGLAAARQIRALDGAGVPSASGRIVLLSIGMSNTTQEFCQPTAQGCAPQTFGGQALADPAVNHAALAIVDGAAGGQTAATWNTPSAANYDRVRDQRLTPRGLTERQVQIAWVKVANPQPHASLPDAGADANLLVGQMGDIVRAMRVRYPSLRQVFVSSRIYAGYATTPLNPEPYAYESGLAVKWLVAAQIEQNRRGTVVDARAGDLAGAPWIAWGPYLWADGMNSRADGLVWERVDLQADGTHPSQSGQRKVGALLLEFFRTSSVTRCWFLAGLAC